MPPIEDFLTKEVPRRFAARPREELLDVGSVELELSGFPQGSRRWTIDPALPDPVREASAPNALCVVTMPRSEFLGLIETPAAAWRLFLTGRVTSTEACRAGRLVRAIWPEALREGMSPALFAAVFQPRLDGLPEATELGAGGVRRHTFIGGPGGFEKVAYRESDGLAVWQGDIVLGTTAQAEAIRTTVESRGPRGLELRTLFPRGFSVETLLWPDKKIPFEIESGVPDKERIEEAIEHWKDKTGLAFLERPNEADRITFRAGKSCSSPVGRQGGQQFIEISSGCSAGNLIHEIGHAVGLYHEHTRTDRDGFVRFRPDNVEAGLEGNFEIPPTERQTLGSYDYSSIMHYGANAYSKEKKQPTLEPTPPDDKRTWQGDPENIGQRAALSDGDVAAIQQLYP